MLKLTSEGRFRDCCTVTVVTQPLQIIAHRFNGAVGHTWMQRPNRYTGPTRSKAFPRWTRMASVGAVLMQVAAPAAFRSRTTECFIAVSTPGSTQASSDLELHGDHGPFAHLGLKCSSRQSSASYWARPMPAKAPDCTSTGGEYPHPPWPLHVGMPGPSIDHFQGRSGPA